MNCASLLVHESFKNGSNTYKIPLKYTLGTIWSTGVLLGIPRYTQILLYVSQYSHVLNNACSFSMDIGSVRPVGPGKVPGRAYQKLGIGTGSKKSLDFLVEH